MLAQQDIHKELHDEKLTDIATIDWNEMKEKITGLISLSVSNEVIYIRQTDNVALLLFLNEKINLLKIILLL